MPALPFVGADAPGSEFAALECRAPCRAELAARGAVAIERGGKAGLEDEWVLRLPKGESFSLDRSSRELQDIAQSRSRRLPLSPEAPRPAQSGSGFRAVLAIDEEWLALRAKPRRFHLLRACRYEPATRACAPLPAPEGDAEIGLLDSAAAAAAAGMTTQRLAYRLPAESALYFAEWTEIEDETAGEPHRITIPSGAGSCIDVTRVKGAGEVLACVPQSSVNPVAEEGPVPDPAAQCVAGDVAVP